MDRRDWFLAFGAMTPKTRFIFRGTGNFPIDQMESRFFIGAFPYEISLYTIDQVSDSSATLCTA